MNDEQLKQLATVITFVIFGALGLSIFAPGLFESPPSTTPSKPVSIAEQRKEFSAMNSKLFDLFSQCDNASAPIDKAMKTKNIYAAYDAATTAYEICDDVSGKIEALSVPDSISQDIRDKLHTALADCAAAYVARADYYSTAQKVFNGDVTPETAHNAKKQNEFADEMSTQCTAEYISAANVGGFSDIVLSSVK